MLNFIIGLVGPQLGMGIIAVTEHSADEFSAPSRILVAIYESRLLEPEAGATGRCFQKGVLFF